MENVAVTKYTTLREPGPRRYYIHFTKEAKPSGCEVVRDLDRVRELVADDKRVFYVDDSCSFCGGPTPCTRDD